MVSGYDYFILCFLVIVPTESTYLFNIIYNSTNNKSKMTSQDEGLEITLWVLDLSALLKCFLERVFRRREEKRRKISVSKEL